MKKQNIGAVPLPFLVIGIVAACIVTRGTVDTVKSGTLKENGKKIWCKMQNKGADYCDAQYK